MTADDKYSLLNRDNLTQPIQIQLSEKQKTFSQFFSASLICKSNFEYFQKRMIPTADLFPKLRALKNVVRSMLKHSRLRGPFEKQYGKTGQTLLKS